jgi:hypothetical protein
MFSWHVAYLTRHWENFTSLRNALWGWEYTIVTSSLEYCSSLKVNRRFRGLVFPPSSGSRINRSKKPDWSRQIEELFSAWLTFRPWRWRQYIDLKRRLALNGLQVVTSLNAELVLLVSLFTMFPISYVDGKFKTLVGTSSIRLPIQLRPRIRGSVHPFPQASSWRSA